MTGDIIATAQPSDIIIPPGVLRAPTPTTEFQTVTNLDASAAVAQTFTTTFQLYDSLGASHLAMVTYTNTAPGAWGYDITVPGAEMTGGVAGTPFSVANGTIGFSAAGILTLVNGAAVADVAIVTPTWTNGALASALNWDLVDANNQPYLTGFSAQSSPASICAERGGSVEARGDQCRR